MALRLSNAFSGLDSELRRHERRQKTDSDMVALDIGLSPTSFMMPGMQVPSPNQHFESIHRVHLPILFH